MALLIKRPQTYLPSSNPIVWVFEAENSTAIAVEIKVGIETPSGNKQIGLNKLFLKPNSRQVEFDVAKIMDNYTQTEVNNSDNLIENLDGVISYNLNVKEVGATGVIAGSKFFQQCYSYNAKFNRVDSFKFDYLDYYVKNGSDNDADFLSDMPLVCSLNYLQKEHLYFLADSDSNVNSLKIQVLNKNGATRTETIPFNPNGKRIHRINLTPFNLESSFSLPLFEMRQLRVGLYNNNVLVSKERIYLLKENSCHQDTTNLVWSNSIGGLTSFSIVNAQETKTATKNTITTNGYTYRENGVFNTGIKTVSTSSKSRYVLTSDVLSDDEFKYLSNIIYSTEVFVELSDGSLYPIQLITDTIQMLQRKYTRKHNRLVIEFEAESGLDIRNNIRTAASNNSGFEYALNFAL